MKRNENSLDDAEPLAVPAWCRYHSRPEGRRPPGPYAATPGGKPTGRDSWNNAVAPGRWMDWLKGKFTGNLHISSEKKTNIIFPVDWENLHRKPLFLPSIWSRVPVSIFPLNRKYPSKVTSKNRACSSENRIYKPYDSWLKPPVDAKKLAAMIRRYGEYTEK